MSSFRQVLVLNPRFDFLRFYESGHFTDCEIHLFEIENSTEFRTIRAHRAILSNSSEFFENMFTSGMIEAQTGILEIHGVSYEHLVEVVKFLYSGTIQFRDSSVMPLLSLARNYGIPALRILLGEYIQRASPETLLGFVAQCFDYELAEELRFLEDTVAEQYGNISMHNLSSALDVATFTRVLAKVKGKRLEEKVEDLSKFLGGWECQPSEKAAIGFLVKEAEPALQKRIREIGRNWLPAGFVFG
jgi:hypothetical protein